MLSTSSRPLAVVSRLGTLSILVALCVITWANVVSAQIRTQADDPISIVGTWSTGSGQVSTGLNFFNPLNQTFNVPNVGGQSYSFTRDGFWESSKFIFQPNAAQPQCSTAQLIWQHGKYTMNQNGSLSLTPFTGDGRQLVQNGCTEKSSSIEPFDVPEYFQGFYIRPEWHFGSGAYYLQLYAFNGQPLPWMWQTYNPPLMLPTQQLKQQVYGQTNVDA